MKGVIKKHLASKVWWALPYSIPLHHPKGKKPAIIISKKLNPTMDINKKKNNPEVHQHECSSYLYNSVQTWIKFEKNDCTKPISFGIVFWCVYISFFFPHCLYIQPKSWCLYISFYIYRVRKNCTTGYQCKKCWFHHTSLVVEHDEWLAVITKKLLFLSA